MRMENMSTLAIARPCFRYFEYIATLIFLKTRNFIQGQWLSLLKFFDELRAQTCLVVGLSSM